MTRIDSRSTICLPDFKMGKYLDNKMGSDSIGMEGKTLLAVVLYLS